jgi:hypothetical protein
VLIDTRQDTIENMTQETNWPSDEQTKKAFELAQNTGEEALRTGERYLRENPIAIVLLTLLVGVVLGALLRPTPRKEPDPVQAVRDWFEKAFQEFIAKLPAATKQMRSIQAEVMDRAGGLRKKLGLWCR